MIEPAARLRAGGNRIRLMTFTSHFILVLARWRIWVTGFALLLCVVLLWRMPRFERLRGASAVGAVYPAVSVVDFALLRRHGDVFRSALVSSVETGGVDWADYRFAGTFFLYDPAGGGQVALRRAVIGYRPSQRQYIVSEGDWVGGAEVVRIDARELVLRADGREGVLPLGAGRAQDGRTVRGGAEVSAEALVAGASRFGQQNAAGTWSMERDALLAYYEELLDEPERLLQVFDSMQPMYTADGEIEGYRLQALGEAAFFEAVGFKEGDAVRAVNTLPMTNRRRAEFFIRQVVENDLSAIVIDIERDGSAQRLVYELR